MLFRFTYRSFKRGKDHTIQGYKSAKDDETRAYYAFTNSKSHWKSINEEVKEWVAANWRKWEMEKPTWFNEALKQVRRKRVAEALSKSKIQKFIWFLLTLSLQRTRNAANSHGLHP